jgi:uncharacterized membrane protein
MSKESYVSSVETAYRHGGQVFLDRLAPLLVLGLAAVATQLVSFGWIPGLRWIASFAFAVLVAIPLRWGFAYVCLRAVRGETPEPRDLVRAFDHYVNAAAAAALVYTAVLIGCLLLIVPGIYIYCRTRFVPYLITQHDMDPVEAIRESWRLSEDHWGAILAINAFGLLLSVFGLLLAGIGTVPAAIWWDLALASYYHAEIESSEVPVAAQSSMT